MSLLFYSFFIKKATQFRQQATQVLSTFITQGMVIDKNRVTIEQLAETLRKWRLEEKNFYAKIRDVFKESASDYEIAPANQKNAFYALVQDKFLVAVTGKTACQLVQERADANKPNMGLQNGNPTTKNVIIGKNYLDAKELEELEILCENFLGFCHLKAFKGEIMTFEEIKYKVNQFLEFNGYKAFSNYSQPNRKAVDKLALDQLDKYKKLKK